ncbi:MAG: DNA alkylation repair protein [Treponema sp.]|nr:DNA alkylation repair protein [Treponema sp.]
MDKIIEILQRHQDVAYGDFLAKLVPTLPRERFIGIRSPEYKKIVKEIKTEAEAEIDLFMKELPHKFHEENVLHVVLINEIKDFETCMAELEQFLPYVDNWAVSDGISPKIFGKNHNKLEAKIKEWIALPDTYTKRVAMLFIKKYFLDEDFKTEYLDLAAQIRSEEYYVNMMTAWLFADALVKQWDSAVKYLQEHKLDSWTHNKTIQKARESFRITAEQKEYLKGLKV